MKNNLKKAAKAVIKVVVKPFSLFVRPCIVFESVPDFSDNTRCVYDELIKRGYQKKYNLIWQVSENEIATLEDRVIWKMRLPHSPKQFALSCSFFFKRKMDISCNRVFKKTESNEPMLYLTHGTPIKSVHDYYNMPDYVDYVITTSPLSTEISSYEYICEKDKFVELGYPRNDYLTKGNTDISKLFGGKYDKVIVWYPTYRQNKNGNFHVTESTLPILCDKEKAELLNEELKKINILIVAKPHFAQDLSYLRISKLSNIKFINDDFFSQNEISSYQFVSACDALLTDYSSIYYDFTLCDKPIGLMWEDIEEYKVSPGLISNYEHLSSGGEKLYCLDDLIRFVNNVANGIDKLKPERNSIRDEINSFLDQNSTNRVVDFVEKIINN